MLLFQEALMTDLGACPVPDGRKVLGKQNYPKLELKLQLPMHMPE